MHLKRLRTIAAVLALIVAVWACLHQFRVDHVGPLAIACLIVVGVWWLRPSFKPVCLGLPVAAFLLLCMDAYILRHRMAVEMRAWSLLMDTEKIEDVLRSPSGGSTVYVVGSHWLDSSYRAYVSDGGLFPKSGRIRTTGSDARYADGVTAQWSGEVFAAAEKFLALRYNERSGLLETFSK